MRVSKELFVFLLLWLLAPLACNAPGRQEPAISVQDLRQTLAAQISATDQGILASQISITPLPGVTPVPAPTLFAGLPTATPGSPQTGIPTDVPPGMFVYMTQSGDTLTALAGRFGVPIEQITSQALVLPSEGLLLPGLKLTIPNVLGDISYPSALLPDSEVIDSPSTVGFDVPGFIAQAGGYLSTYEETVQGERLTGAQIVQRVALESSVNPRFLLALLEFRSHWVLGQPANPKDVRYPIGFHIVEWQGLYRELVITATHLNVGYYGWRTGKVVLLTFGAIPSIPATTGGVRISPALNAGSSGVQYLFSKLYAEEAWQKALYGPGSFPYLYQQMFGDAWIRAAMVEPLFPVGLSQPPLELPFAAGQRWSLTGGPHPSWKTGSPRGALDFAPVTGEPECAVSKVWVLASASGLVARSERNVVAIDLDGDGHEQTGWVLIYLHVADQERVPAGTWVKVNDPIGHPSCEGGESTGTHVHFARKYNGEWLAADDPLPFVLSAWRVYAGEKDYQGEMRKGDQVVVASPVGPKTSIIVR